MVSESFGVDEGAFRVSFAEIMVDLASDGIVLALPSDLRNRSRTSIIGKSLADLCHIYFVLRRPGLMFMPGTVKSGQGNIRGKIKLTKDGYEKVSDFLVPCLDSNLDWSTTQFSYRMIESKFIFPSYRETLPAYVVPSLGHIIDTSAHEAEVLYIGQSFGDGDRTALDRLLDHSTLQSVLADVNHNTPDQEVLLLLVEYARPKLHLLIPPESTYPRNYVIDDIEIDQKIGQRFNQLSHSLIPLKNQVSIIEAALINYFKPSYNEIFVNQEPQKSHKHLLDCYNEDFSALAIEINTEDAQIALYSGSRPSGLHHLAKFDLHDPRKRKSFFRLSNFDKDIGLLQSGPIAPIQSLRNGRFAVLGWQH